MPNPAMMKFFEYAHLPEKLQTVSKPIGEVAKQMEEVLTDSAEKSAGLRKLLEAKDCFVRAALPVVILIAFFFGCIATDVSAGEPTYGGYTYDQLGSYAGSATKEEHEASVRSHERAEAVQDAQRRANANSVRQLWKPKQPLPSPSRDEADSQEWRDAEVAKWKAAYDREQARKAKKSGKKPKGDKAAAVDRDSPFQTVGLFSFLRTARNVQSACANGQCGVKAVKPLPAKPSGTKAVKPVAPKPALTNDEKREAFYRHIREGNYGSRVPKVAK